MFGGEERCIQGFSKRARDPLEGTGLDGRIILK